MMKKRSNKKRILFLILLASFLALFLWTLWGNTALQQNEILVTGELLPEAFSGYRIAHVSDLHNTEMGRGNETLLGLLKSAQPDIIAITGDLIDRRRTDLDVAEAFVSEAVKIAPCYYVTGNHEGYTAAGVYEELEQRMLAAGVHVLRGKAVSLERQGETISLLGMEDPAFTDGFAVLPEQAEFPGEYRILLSHRPELFSQYCSAQIDLVLCGHAHGGQIRLPFIGGLIAPGQGLFPEYDAGLYTEGRTHMVVSRGIGNSLFPLRFNNRPEVVIIELQRG